MTSMTPERDPAVPMRDGVRLFANMSRRADHTSAECYAGMMPGDRPWACAAILIESQASTGGDPP